MGTRETEFLGEEKNISTTIRCQALKEIGTGYKQ